MSEPINAPLINPWLKEYNNLLQECNDIYRRAAKKLGVTECTLWILYSLRLEGRPVTQRSLCALMQQPKQTINSALKNMENDGFIRLAPGGDRRTREITLTEKGLELATCTADVIAMAEAKPFSELEPQEREQFLLTYRKLNSLLRRALLESDTD